MSVFPLVALKQCPVLPLWSLPFSPFPHLDRIIIIVKGKLLTDLRMGPSLDETPYWGSLAPYLPLLVSGPSLASG